VEKLRKRASKARAKTIEKIPPDKLDTFSAKGKIKDGIFKLLFEKPENAAELYSALTGTTCNPDEIQIITITTTISGKQKNDLAFVVNNKALVVGEHQSTTSKNMPIRFLMYSGQLFEKWIKMKGEEKFLYRTKLYKIPTPEFVVFYNGTTKKPEKDILSLSDAFVKTTDKALGSLELKVPVYNINKGMNKDLLSKSDMLRQYAEFILNLRDFKKRYEDYNQVVKETLTHCIENNILSDFLKEHGGKIVSILTTEYNEELAMRVYGEELLEDRNEEIAKKMLTKGYPVSVIAEISELTIEEVLEIESSLQISNNDNSMQEEGDKNPYYTEREYLEDKASWEEREAALEQENAKLLKIIADLKQNKNL